MKTVAGIFASREAAARAIQRLRGIGVHDEAVNVLAPGMSERQIAASVPTDEGEQPGMGTATGASIGLPIGAAIGHKVEDALSTGLPRDELYFYADALRRGRIVLIVQVENDHDAEIVRAALDAAGAESIDAARAAWWVGLRDEEARAYAERGGDFAADEPAYRRGFEAAMLPFMRGRGYDIVLVELRDMYLDVCQTDAFRRGFERGQAYDETRLRPERPEDRAA